MSYRKEHLNPENKTEFYHGLSLMLTGIISTEEDGLAQLSNAAALLSDQLSDVNWVGFYLLKKGELVVGPFQGKPACTRIKMGRGVCGTAASTRKTIVVEDVNEFPGHIACDAASASEIVVPLFRNEELVGVLDVDSPSKSRFTASDQEGMEKLGKILSEHIHWDLLIPNSRGLA